MRFSVIRSGSWPEKLKFLKNSWMSFPGSCLGNSPIRVTLGSVWLGYPIYNSWIGPKGFGLEHGMCSSHERGILVLYLFWVQLMVPVYSQLSNTSTLGIVHLFGLKRGLVPLVYSWRLVLSNPKRDFTKSEWTIHDQLRRQHFFFFKKTNFRDKYHYPKRPKVSSKF